MGLTAQWMAWPGSTVRHKYNKCIFNYMYTSMYIYNYRNKYIKKYRNIYGDHD